jgi:hypothetical protein
VEAKPCESFVDHLGETRIVSTACSHRILHNLSCMFCAVGVRFCSSIRGEATKLMPQAFKKPCKGDGWLEAIFY